MIANINTLTQVATYQDLGLETPSFGQYCSVHFQFMPSYAQSNRMCYIGSNLGYLSVTGNLPVACFLPNSTSTAASSE